MARYVRTARVESGMPRRFGTPWRFGGPGRPPVRWGQIRGPWLVTRDLIWPAVVWNQGRCWAYLHDLALDTLVLVMDRLRAAELARNAPHGSLVDEGP